MAYSAWSLVVLAITDAASAGITYILGYPTVTWIVVAGGIVVALNAIHSDIASSSTTAATHA